MFWKIFEAFNLFYRTFLDNLPEPTAYETSSDSGESSGSDRSDGGHTRSEEKKAAKSRSNCDYERYKTLIQNDYLGIDETSCLKQIYQEEELSSHASSGMKIHGGSSTSGNGSAPHHPVDKNSKNSYSSNTTTASSTNTAKVGSSNYFLSFPFHTQSTFGFHFGIQSQALLKLFFSVCYVTFSSASFTTIHVSKIFRI